MTYVHFNNREEAMHALYQFVLAVSASTADPVRMGNMAFSMRRSIEDSFPEMFK